MSTSNKMWHPLKYKNIYCWIDLKDLTLIWVTASQIFPKYDKGSIFEVLWKMCFCKLHEKNEKLKF